MTTLAIVALFSSNTETGSLVFVVSGYLFFLLIINSFFLHANQPKCCVWKTDFYTSFPLDLRVSCRPSQRLRQ